MTSTVPSAEPTADGRTLRRERSATLLYEAANELFAQRAYDDVSIEEICERAGVGRATFFRIYETKTGLLREFNRRITVDAAGRIDAAGDIDLFAALGLVRAAILDAWRDAGPGHGAMALELARPPGGDIHDTHRELFDLVLSRVELAIATGEITDAIPAELATSLAVIHLTAPVAQSLKNGVDREELSRVLLDQWYAGMTSVLVSSGRRETKRAGGKR